MEDDDTHLYLNKNVYIDDQEVRVKVPTRKDLASIVVSVLYGTMVLTPYFIEVPLILKILFAIVIYLVLFNHSKINDEIKYLKDYILLDDNKRRIKIVK